MILRHYLSFLALSILSFSTATQAQESTPKTELHYTVGILNSNLGEIHTTITQDKNAVQIDSITRAEGLASLVMGGDLKQSCTFETEENRIKTLQSNVEKVRKNAFQKSVQLDWENNKINFEDDVSLDIPEGYIVDMCNFHFAAAYTDLEHLKNNTIYALDAKRQRTKGYVFKSASPETLETAAGLFNTTKIVLERELNPERSFIFWVAKEHPHYPIKMVDHRKKNSSTMTLKSIETSIPDTASAPTSTEAEKETKQLER